MRAMTTVGLGFALVLLDLNIERFDVLPDTVGWLLVAVGLGAVGRLHPGFSVGSVAAWVATLMAAVSAVRSLVTDGDPLFLDSTLMVVDTVVVVATCTALAAVVGGTDPRAARSLRIVRAVDVVAAAVSVPLTVWAVLTYPDGSPRGLEAGAFTPLALVLVVVLLGVRVWFIVLLLRCSDPVEALRGSPATGVPPVAATPGPPDLS